MGEGTGSMKYLTRQEEIYLLSIWKLKHEAYGIRIRQMIERMTGRRLSYGALYFTLEQLYKKNYVHRTEGPPTPVRGGCRKIFYALTPAGRQALKRVRILEGAIWSDVSLLSLEEEG